MDHPYISSSCDVDMVEHEEIISTDEVGSKSDENFCAARLKLPKRAVPLDTMKHITDLQHLVNGLRNGCKKCLQPLNMVHSCGVLPRGLGGILYVC